MKKTFFVCLLATLFSFAAQAQAGDQSGTFSNSQTTWTYTLVKGNYYTYTGLNSDGKKISDGHAYWDPKTRSMLTVFSRTDSVDDAAYATAKYTGNSLAVDVKTLHADGKVRWTGARLMKKH